VTNPHCPSQSTYFFNSSCNNTTAGRIQHCMHQKSLAANFDETLHPCKDSFSRNYTVFITKRQPRLIYGHTKNVLQKMSYVVILMHQNSSGHRIVWIHTVLVLIKQKLLCATYTKLFKAVYPLYLTIIFLFFSVQYLLHLPYMVLTSFIKSMSTEQDLLPFLHEDNCIGFP